MRFATKISQLIRKPLRTASVLLSFYLIMMNRIRQIAYGYWYLMSLFLVTSEAWAFSPMTPGDSDRTAIQQSVMWPIDTKIDTVFKMVNNTVLTKSLPTKAEQQRRQQQFLALFAPSGYFIIMLPNKTEEWVSASQFLKRLSRNKGVRYQLKTAKVIHFTAVSRSRKGEYSSQAVIYFDVNRFTNHLPVTQAISRVTIPLMQPPPALDYWQIYELRVVELSNSVLASPH